MALAGFTWLLWVFVHDHWSVHYFNHGLGFSSWNGLLRFRVRSDPLLRHWGRALPFGHAAVASVFRGRSEYGSQQL